MLASFLLPPKTLGPTCQHILTWGPASPIFHSTKCPPLLFAFPSRRHYRINITLPVARSPQIKSGSAPGLWVTKTSFRNWKSVKNYALIWTTWASLRQFSNFFSIKLIPPWDIFPFADSPTALLLTCLSRSSDYTVFCTTTNPEVNFLVCSFFFFSPL